jgi:hypothetical protein
MADSLSEIAACGNQRPEVVTMTIALDIRRAVRTVRLALWIAAALLALAPVGGCGAHSDDEQTLTVEAQQDLMTRWNAVADGVAIPSGFGFDVDFKWEAFDQFPHPTFKGGSEEAYRGFADILIAFYEKDDNFDFLIKNKCFSITLRYVFTGGQDGFRTSFAQLTDEFSQNDWMTAETRAKLAAFSVRIRAAQ